MINAEDKIYNSLAEEKFSNYRNSNLLDIFIILFFLIIIIFLTPRISGLLTFPLFIDILVLIFAVFRLTKLVTSDHITQFWRDVFFDLEIKKINGEDLVKRKFPKGGLKLKIAKLLDCPWCTSIWIATISLFVWVNYPNVKFFFAVIALSGIGTLLFLLMKKLSS